MRSKAPWSYEIRDDGTVILDLGAHPAPVIVGDMETVCGECLSHLRLAVAAPELLAAARHLIESAEYRTGVSVYVSTKALERLKEAIMTATGQVTEIVD